MNKEGLDELMDFISGKGKFRFLGNGIYTHPGFDDNQNEIYAACEELERQGRVVRKIDEPGHVVFIEA